MSEASTGCSTRCWPNVGSSAAWRSTMSSFRPCRRSRTDGTSLASGGGSASPVGLPRRIPVTFHGTPRPRYVLPPRMISRQSLVSPQWRSSFGPASPMFLEGGPPDLAIVRANHEELFALGAVHFLASVEAEPVGLLTLLRASRFAPICAEDAPFVSTTATDARYRGKGIGGALVAAALAWAREREYGHLDVSYLSSNLLSRSFWRGCGFAPVGWKVARRLPDSLFKVGGDAADELGA